MKALTGKFSQVSQEKQVFKEGHKVNSEQLSLEQEFELRTFAIQVQHFSQEEAQDFLVELYKTTMIRENLYRQILKDAWGIGRDASEVL